MVEEKTVHNGMNSVAIKSASAPHPGWNQIKMQPGQVIDKENFGSFVL